MANPAANAPCILRLFVERGTVRAELEIGEQGLKAFQNLLPQALYERLPMSQGVERRSESERRKSFFHQDLVLTLDGKTIVGRIQDLRWGPKILRDPSSTEPLPPDQQKGPRALQVSITYSYAGEPETMSLEASRNLRPHPPTQLGLRVIHQGVPVADFRLLEKREVVDLDWNDAWFTSFQNPLFYRFHQDLLQIFLYVKANELRAEILFRPRDFQEFLDLGLRGKEKIPVPLQKDLMARLRGFLPRHLTLRVDGEAVPTGPATLNLLALRVGDTERLPLQSEVSAADTFVGAVFVWSRDEWPKTVDLGWSLYPKLAPLAVGIPVDLEDRPPVEMSREYPTLTWTNQFETAPQGSLEDLPLPPEPSRLHLPLPSILLGTVGMGLLALCLLRHASRLRLGGLGLLLLLVALLSSETGVLSVPDPLSPPPPIPSGQPQQILQTALTHIYRSYDFRDEDRIYDELAKTVDGPLLPELYLQIRRSLEIAKQDGVLAKVDSIALTTTKIRTSDALRGLDVDCTWQVTGSVGHWGHWHRRFNAYKARMRMEVRGRRWKLTALDIRDEKRL